jgi:hypothetical protein
VVVMVSALFDQYQLLLPALGLAFVAFLIGLAWVLTSPFVEPRRTEPRPGQGVWPQSPSDFGSTSIDSGSSDCGAGDAGCSGGD